MAKVGDILSRGDALGIVPEGRFQHQIMVPFSQFGKVKITHVAKAGLYTMDHVVAKGEDEKGKDMSSHGAALACEKCADRGKENPPHADDGYGNADPRHAVSRS